MKPATYFANNWFFDNLLKLFHFSFAKKSQNFSSKKITKNQAEPSKENSFSNQDFLKSIIHELKNSLHAISGISEILKDEEVYKISPYERKEYLKNLDESVIDLKEMVFDLLDFASNDNQDFSFNTNLSEKIDIKELILRAVKLNKNYALKSSIKIESEIAEDVSLINLDAKRTKQILTNLISNSVKYSPRKTTIKISAKNFIKNQQKYLQIIVSDQGFGMTQSQIKLAFEKYKTIKNINSNKVDSFGLGLPIVKKLVELQNGKILVNSTPNKGTDFILEFGYYNQAHL